jgi:hypothetical protein
VPPLPEGQSTTNVTDNTDKEETAIRSYPCYP